MAKEAVRHEEKKPTPPAVKAAPDLKSAEQKSAPKDPLRPYPAGFVVGPLPEGQSAGDVAVIEPFLASDVAPGFTNGTVPGADKIAANEVDTNPYGTETPPRQTPPTSIDNAMKHSPPSFHDSNGAKITSTAPTLTSISPNTGTAGPGSAITITLTGTNFDRATFATFYGSILSNTVYVSATSLTCQINPGQFVAGVYQVTAKNPAGESVQRAFTFS